MIDHTDFFSFDNFRYENQHPSIFYKQGPIRISEHPIVKADREINKHQEDVKHKDNCRCKQYEYNDLVVMYEHIEQYPQFKCYCNFCLMLLGMQCDKDIPEEEVNHAIRFQLAGNLLIKEGIDLTK